MQVAASQDTISLIYNTIRQNGAVNRSEIAEQTGLVRSTISIQVKYLLQRNLILEKTRGAYQRKLKLTINSQMGYFIGGLLGTERFSVQLVDLDYNVISQRDLIISNISEPVSTNAKILAVIKDLIRASKIPKNKILGTGLGFPFPVNFALGIPDSPPYIPLWGSYPLRSIYETALELPVLIDNDVNVMVWGELVLRPELDNTIFVKLGTGIGCGIVIHHSIYRGDQGAAGDIGHIRIEGYEESCYCGHSGCLEAIAGGKAIAKTAQINALERSPYLKNILQQRKFLTAKDVGDGAKANDMYCIGILKEKGNLIGSVVSSLVNFINPNNIIIGGGVSQAGQHLLQSIRQKVLYNSPHLATANLTIEATKNASWGGALGAAALIGEHTFNEKFSSLLE